MSDVVEAALGRAIEPEVEAEIFGSDLLAVREFIKDADFSQRELAFKEVLLQDANLASIEAVEAADELHGIGMGCGDFGHGDRIA